MDSAGEKRVQRVLPGDDENRKIVKFFPRLFLDKLEIEETDF